jgi:hypothetical protein
VLNAFLPTPFIIIIAPPVDADTGSKVLNPEVLWKHFVRGSFLLNRL